MELPSEYLVPFYLYQEQEGVWNTNTGKYEKPPPERIEYQGIVLPLSTDDLKFSDSGTFSIHDRKIYTDEKLEIGSTIEYQDENYTVRAEKDYSEQADIYIYFAKRVTRHD